MAKLKTVMGDINYTQSITLTTILPLYFSSKKYISHNVSIE